MWEENTWSGWLEPLNRIQKVIHACCDPLKYTLWVRLNLFSSWIKRLLEIDPQKREPKQIDIKIRNTPKVWSRNSFSKALKLVAVIGKQAKSSRKFLHSFRLARRDRSGRKRWHIQMLIRIIVFTLRKAERILFPAEININSHFWHTLF